MKRALATLAALAITFTVGRYTGTATEKPNTETVKPVSCGIALDNADTLFETANGLVQAALKTLPIARAAVIAASDGDIDALNSQTAAMEIVTDEVASIQQKVSQARRAYDGNADICRS